MKKALVLGAGGFIGNHLVNRLKDEGYWVRGIDLKYPDFTETMADDFIVGDLCHLANCQKAIQLSESESVNEIYQLAADMGGAGYIFTAENDANVIHNSAAITLNIADLAIKLLVDKVFYCSSACIYPECNQLDPANPKCSEESSYPPCFL